MILITAAPLLLYSLAALNAAPQDLSVSPPTPFDTAQFAEPESVLWPGAFWLWNASLEPQVLRSQLGDMVAHGFRSVCMLPMPHAFRPDSTNNSLDPDYLTPEYFERVRLAVDEAERLGMHWWLYDEGGWPSGQALGKVTEGHPEFGQHRLTRERIETKEAYTVPQDALILIVEGTPRKPIPPGSVWSPLPGEEAFLYRISTGGYVDVLNPAVTDRFIELTHEGYKRAIDDHFGKTVRFTFTDEPGAPNLDPPKSITWTPGFDAAYTQQFGKSIFDILPSLFVVPGPDISLVDAQARLDFYDLWTGRFRDMYFGRIQTWCHENHLGSGGHLNGEDETINVIRYGFGQALRQLRAMDVPGVDVIWRQLFPGKPNQHFFPKYASSAAHQNGTRYALSESFCVYGNGLTPQQMKWLVDYQYLRGINLLVVGCYPLSTRGHHMTGERPHFGPVDPLWDHLRGFNAYVARLGYVLSSGTPKISTALYYPARDMWALSGSAEDVVRTHDQLAQALFEHQCDFDLIDDDLLTDPATHIENGALVAGAMRYDTVLCGEARWMHPAALAMLKQFAASGGKVLCVGHAAGTNGTLEKDVAAFCEKGTLDQLVLRVTPTVLLEPVSRDIRATARSLANGEILALFNEGENPFEGKTRIKAAHVYQLEPQSGVIRLMAKNTEILDVRLTPGESIVLLLTDESHPAEPALSRDGDEMKLDALITVKATRHFFAGEHDFETTTPDTPPVSFSEGTAWKTWLGEDYSGEVEYRATIELPDSWAGKPLELETGPIEYATTIFVDGTAVGHLVWPPWKITLPPCTHGKHEIIIRVANTLANELTSERVIKLWAEKQGPGWPSPYHKRALEFERESRGGGLQGPIVLYKKTQQE